MIEEKPIIEPETIVSGEITADIQKKLGNDAFAAKKYQEAINYYTEAVKLDPENAIYYSNRSACYAFLKKWPEALNEAILCLSKDSKSVKGYYRLAQAQIELGQLEDAETTIIAALKLDSGDNISSIPTILFRITLLITTN
jgi:tetratricopeptide (TPR) repeat protein